MKNDKTNKQLVISNSIELKPADYFYVLDHEVRIMNFDNCEFHVSKKLPEDFMIRALHNRYKSTQPEQVQEMKSGDLICCDQFEAKIGKSVLVFFKVEIKNHEAVFTYIAEGAQ